MGAFSKVPVTARLSDGINTYDVQFGPLGMLTDNDGKVWAFYAPWDKQFYVLKHDDNVSQFVAKQLESLKNKALIPIGGTTGAAIGMQKGMPGVGLGGAAGMIAGWGASQFLKHLPANYSQPGYYSNGVWKFKGPIYYRG